MIRETKGKPPLLGYRGQLQAVRQVGKEAGPLPDLVRRKLAMIRRARIRALAGDEN